MHPDQVSSIIKDSDLYNYALLITKIKTKLNFNNMLNLDQKCAMAVTVKQIALKFQILNLSNLLLA